MRRRALQIGNSHRAGRIGIVGIDIRHVFAAIDVSTSEIVTKFMRQDLPAPRAIENRGATSFHAHNGGIGKKWARPTYPGDATSQPDVWMDCANIAGAGTGA